MRKLLVLLLTFMAVAACGRAAMAQADEDMLIQVIMTTPANQRDAAYEANRASLSPQLERHLLGQAVALANQGKFAEAQARASVADDVDDYVHGRKGYQGANLYQLGNYLANNMHDREALPLADEILSHNPDAFRGHVLRGFIFARLRDLDKAKQELDRAVLEQPDSQDAHLTLAQVYLLKGDTQAALNEYRTVLRIDPSNAQAKDAVALITAQAKPASLNVLASDHFNKAEHLFSQGQYREAINEYQQALQSDPKLARAYTYMGDSYFSLGDRQKAIQCYEKAISIDPKDRQAYRFLGDVCERMFDESREMKWLDRAIENYEKALQADPNYATAAADLARARQKKASVASP